jgi:hypothetical protein
MSAQIYLKLAGGSRVALRTPEPGYAVSVALGLHSTRVRPAGLVTFDDATTARSVSFSFLCDATTTSALQTFYDTTARAKDSYLILPARSGFYPFGPDKGDGGEFKVHIIGFTPEAVLSEPYKWFRINLSLAGISFPTHALPTAIPEGDFSIGTCTQLQFPYEQPGTELIYSVGSAVTRTGIPYSVAKVSDSQLTTLTLECNTSNAAKLLDYLIGKVRAGTVALGCPANSYLFGAKVGSGSINCKMTNEIITVTHDSPDSFTFKLTFLRTA